MDRSCGWNRRGRGKRPHEWRGVRMEPPFDLLGAISEAWANGGLTQSSTDVDSRFSEWFIQSCRRDPFDRQRLPIVQRCHVVSGRIAESQSRRQPRGGPVRINVYPVSGSAPTTWVAIGANENLPGLCVGCQGGATAAVLAGWWPKWGIVFWAIPGDTGNPADAMQLDVVTVPAQRPEASAERFRRAPPTP